MKEKIRYS